jgi:hypothetical protein
VIIYPAGMARARLQSLQTRTDRVAACNAKHWLNFD